MNNAQIAEVFQDIANLLEMKGDKPFTIRAYQRAARTIERLPMELGDMLRENQNLQEIPGIGKAISDKIAEMVNTNSLAYYDRLKSEFPDGIMEVLEIPGLGPKTVKRLWTELDITTVAQLEIAIQDGSLAALPRLGKKTAENIARQIQFQRSKSSRMPIARAQPVCDRIIAALTEQCPSISHLQPGGSIRRCEETIGDIDLVCTADDPAQVLATLVSLPNVADILGHGDTKASVYLTDGIQVDLRVVADQHFGALLQYFSGNLQHNILLRDRANSLNLSLNEYGVTDRETGEITNFPDEQSLYARLGLQYIPPELRQGEGEVKAALNNEIPALVQLSDIKGDLHDHTDWSDGRDTMDEMILAAKQRGLEYLAITDHSVGRAIANGLSPERLQAHAAQVRRAEQRIGGIKLLCGTEMDIRADGSLDYDDGVLQSLDWVIASVHSAMNQDAPIMTERIIAAMRNPHVDAIGHLSTRLIGERQPVSADYEAIFQAAAQTGTALEINASPERLDLKDSHAARARQLGVPLVISTDAHTTEALHNTRYGVGVARRAWCRPQDILNTMPAAEFLEWLRLPKAERMNRFAKR